MKEAKFVVTLNLDPKLTPQRVADALQVLIDWVLAEDVEGAECMEMGKVEVVSVLPEGIQPKPKPVLSAKERKRLVQGMASDFVDTLSCELIRDERACAERLALEGHVGFNRRPDDELIEEATGLGLGHYLPERLAEFAD